MLISRFLFVQICVILFLKEDQELKFKCGKLRFDRRLGVDQIDRSGLAQIEAEVSVRHEPFSSSFEIDSRCR